MAHYEEWFGSVSRLDEVDCLIGDNVRDIAFLDMCALSIDERRVEVLALARHHIPIIETRWFMSLPFP